MKEQKVALSHWAFRISCQSMKQWYLSSWKDQEYNLRRMFFRSVLEVILREKFPNSQTLFRATKIPRSKCNSFQDFVGAALGKLKASKTKVEGAIVPSLDELKKEGMSDDEVEGYYLKYLPHMPNLVAYYSLQLVL